MWFFTIFLKICWKCPRHTSRWYKGCKPCFALVFLLLMGTIYGWVTEHFVFHGENTPKTPWNFEGMPFQIFQKPLISFHYRALISCVHGTTVIHPMKLGTDWTMYNWVITIFLCQTTPGSIVIWQKLTILKLQEVLKGWNEKLKKNNKENRNHFLFLRQSKTTFFFNRPHNENNEITHFCYIPLISPEKAQS